MTHRGRKTFSVIVILFLLMVQIFTPLPVRGQKAEPVREIAMVIAVVLIGLFSAACSLGAINTPKIDFHILGPDETGLLYATATAIAGEVQAAAPQPVAEVYQNNPAMVDAEWAQRWDGRLQPNYGGAGGGLQPFMLITPEPPTQDGG